VSIAIDKDPFLSKKAVISQLHARYVMAANALHHVLQSTLIFAFLVIDGQIGRETLP
jgi:hypothetical protein